MPVATDLDRILLDGRGRLRPVESRALAVEDVDLVSWCARRLVDVIPTTELISWLRYRIEGRLALEVAAGDGAIGRALGIRMTDRDPRAPDVERLDALEAVRRYDPQVVVGAWLTELDGVSVEDILAHPSVEAFIHVGNSGVRRHRALMRKRTEVVHAPWILSGSRRPHLNCIAVWETGRRRR
jgi:hypothetical protein